MQSTLAFLEQHEVQEGVMAIRLLLAHWSRDQLDFCGAYDVKVLTAALGGLLLCGNTGVLNTPVPGSLIVNVEEGRVTRSSARASAAGRAAIDLWTQVCVCARVCLPMCMCTYVHMCPVVIPLSEI